MHQELAVPVDQPAQEFIFCHHQKADRIDCDNNGPQSFKKCVCRKHFRHNKGVAKGSRSWKRGSNVVTTRKVLFRLAGDIVGDCTAVRCCPCAIASLLAWILAEVPSAIASKMITQMKRVFSVQDSAGRQHSSQDDILSLFDITRSNMEPYKEGDVQAVYIFRFDPDNLLKHFDAEFVGFGSLSLKRE